MFHFVAWSCPINKMVLIAVFCLCVGEAHTQRVAIEINQGWEFHEAVATAVAHSAETAAWHPATVPGVVQTDLLQNGMIPDPFKSDNESSLQWIGQTNWEYRTTLTLTALQLEHANADLVFEGLDTFATVYINEHKVLDADNMFRNWRVSAKDLLRLGANTLRIIFTSPFVKMQGTVDALPYHLPESGSGKPIFPVAYNSIQSYVRKAPYNWGWDWAPRFITAGVWRHVYLELWDKLRITDVFVEQKDVTATSANLLVHVFVEASQDERATIRLTDKLMGGTSLATGPLAQTVDLHTGHNEIFFPVRVNNPKLWWPNGYGKQDRYEFTAQAITNSKVEDAKTVRTGLRSLVLRREKDQWGRSFEFVVNGIPIFAKGANVVPFDSFPSRVIEADYRKVLEGAKETNLNMLRNWGGGYYETNLYYDIADELGLLVWQEFMFGGGLYPGDYKFTQSVRDEAADQITRLRNHPCIALYSGNNEVEYKYFGHKDWKVYTKSLTLEQRDEVWGNYMRLFSGILPEVVARFDPEAAYWPSSPSNNFDAPEGNTQYGDDHYWGVWHGGAPFSLYEKQFPRFMSEYGFQAFPELKTLESFAAPEEMKLDSKVMLAHQKNQNGNEIIHLALTKYYGEPKSFNFLLYASQVLQAEGIQIAAEHLRRNRPHVMGSLYWQLNDNWPVVSSSGIDYFGRWKALQYYARRFYAPVLVSPHEEDGNMAVYVVNDHAKAESASLSLRLVDFNGNTLWHKEQKVTAAPLESTVVYRLPLTEMLAGADRDNVVLRAELVGKDGGLISSNDHFFEEFPKNLKLPDVKVAATVTETNGKKVVHLKSTKLARAVYVNFGEVEAHVSDNYFNLLAGENRDIVVTTKASVSELVKGLTVTSQKDAF
jgi:beta-mannosidase